MAEPQMVMYEEEFRQIQAIVDALVQAANASVAFIIDKNGQLIAAGGDAAHIDTTSLASLTAGNIAATGGMAALYTYVEDVDRALTRAREAGAGVEPPEEKPWGDRVATVTDPDGYRWVLATFKKLAPFV